MERLTIKDRLLLVGLFLLEAIIMFCIVPKANADEISVQVELVLGLSLALMVSLAILIKHNRGRVRLYFLSLSYALRPIFKYPTVLCFMNVVLSFV